MCEEATRFAIELLLPARLVREYARGVNILDGHEVKALADKFRVEPSLMAFRLGELSCV